MEEITVSCYYEKANRSYVLMSSEPEILAHVPESPGVKGLVLLINELRNSNFPIRWVQNDRPGADTRSLRKGEFDDLRTGLQAIVEISSIPFSLYLVSLPPPEVIPAPQAGIAKPAETKPPKAQTGYQSTPQRNYEPHKGSTNNPWDPRKSRSPRVK